MSLEMKNMPTPVHNETEESRKPGFLTTTAVWLRYVLLAFAVLFLVWFALSARSTANEISDVSQAMVSDVGGAE
jgi:hypothetical protein